MWIGIADSLHRNFVNPWCDQNTALPALLLCGCQRNFSWEPSRENFILIWQSGVGEWQPCVSHESNVDRIINSILSYHFLTISAWSWYELQPETCQRPWLHLILIQMRVQKVTPRNVAGGGYHFHVFSSPPLPSSLCRWITCLFHRISCSLAWVWLHSQAMVLTSISDLLPVHCSSQNDSTSIFLFFFAPFKKYQTFQVKW